VQFITLNKAEYVCYKNLCFDAIDYMKIRSFSYILHDGVRVVPLLHGNGDTDNRADSIVSLFGKRPKVWRFGSYGIFFNSAMIIINIPYSAINDKSIIKNYPLSCTKINALF
jgi:hypothetical protein